MQCVFMSITWGTARKGTLAYRSIDGSSSNVSRNGNSDGSSSRGSSSISDGSTQPSPSLPLAKAVSQRQWKTRKSKALPYRCALTRCSGALYISLEYT